MCPVKLELVEDNRLGSFWALNAGDKKPFVPKIKEAKLIEFKTTDVVVDIGAYIGTFAMAAAKAGAGSVVAYEPTLSTFEALEENGKDFHFAARRMAVVGDANVKSVAFYVSSGVGVRNSIVQARGRVICVVEAISYEEATKLATIVKVDVEGAEYDYSHKITPTLRAVMIDFHPRKEFDWIARAEKIVDAYRSNGFEAIAYPKFKCGWNASWDACAVLVREVKPGKNS